MTRNVLARAADQRVAHNGNEITIHDKGHKPTWRRSGTARDSGEITFRVEHVDGVPVLYVRMVEIHQPRGEKPDVRESVFEVFGTAAIETLEIVREIEGRASMQPKGGL